MKHIGVHCEEVGLFLIFIVMINRTPEQTCLLCCAEGSKATATNSHFTPASLIASAIGKRDYEDSKRIDAGGKIPFDSFYGSANLSNTDPEIKPHHHAADYIFCPSCEKKLGVLEGIIGPVLTTKLKDPNQAVNFPAKKYDYLDIISCNRISPKLMFLYFYSVIWRQSFQQQLEKENTVVLEKNEMELLRSILNDCLCFSSEEYEKIDFKVIPIFVITAVSCADPTHNLIMPHSKFVNPYLFCANEFLISIEFPTTSKTPVYFNLDDRIYLKELLNSSLQEPFKIGIITDKEWLAFLKHTADHEAGRFINKYVEMLSEKTGIGKLRCRLLLCSCANRKNKTSGKLFGEDFIECYEQLLKTFSK